MKRMLAAALAVLVLACPSIAGPPLRITISNGSKLTVTELFVTMPDSDWGKNRVGKPLQPKEKLQVVVEDGADKCVLDVLVRVAEGKDFDYRMRFCEQRTFTFRGRL